MSNYFQSVVAGSAGVFLRALTPAVLLLYGCKPGASRAPREENRPAEPGVFRTNDVARSYLDLSPDEIMVRVGSRGLTRGTFDELVDEWILLNRKVGPRSNRQDEEKLRWQAISYVYNNSMSRMAMLEEADARGIKPGAEDLDTATRHFAKLAEKLGGYEAWSKRIAGGKDTIMRRTREEAALKALLDAQFGDTLQVREEDAGSLRDELLKHSAESEATNQLHYTTLTNLRARVVSGEFGSITQDVEGARGRLPSGVGTEGVVTQNAINLTDEKGAYLMQLKPGQCSRVYEEDMHFGFVMLIESAIDEDTPDLSRFTFIEFSAPLDPGWDVPPLKVLQRDLSRKRRLERMEPWVLELMRKAGVVFPNGVRLFDEVKPATGRRSGRGGGAQAFPQRGGRSHHPLSLGR